MVSLICMWECGDLLGGGADSFQKRSGLGFWVWSFWVQDKGFMVQCSEGIQLSAFVHTAFLQVLPVMFPVKRTLNPKPYVFAVRARSSEPLWEGMPL